MPETRDDQLRALVAELRDYAEDNGGGYLLQYVDRIESLLASPPALSELVTTTLSNPDWVIHQRRLDCEHEAPHLMAACGAFAASPPAPPKYRGHIDSDCEVARGVGWMCTCETPYEKAKRIAERAECEAERDAAASPPAPAQEWLSDLVVIDKALRYPANGHHHCRGCSAGTANQWQHTENCPILGQQRAVDAARAAIQKLASGKGLSHD